MSQPSRELLEPPSKPSVLDILLLGRKEQETKKKSNPKQHPTTTVSKSKILGKVRNFLGEIAKANEQLAIDAQVKPREEIDLEALTGNETEYIEMDLLLGVADLNSDGGVAAAETTMCSIQSTARPNACSTMSEEEEDDESDPSDIEGGNNTVKFDESVKRTENKEPKKKRQKIVVLN